MFHSIILTDDGDVGISTESPSEKLEVAGNILQPSGFHTATPRIKALDLNGLWLTDKDNTGIIQTECSTILKKFFRKKGL